jgi:uncharacterized membrane protein
MTESNVPATIGEGDDKVLPAIVYGLYLIGLANGLTILIGLVVAYIYRDKANQKTRSHYLFQIRTSWMGLALMALCVVLFVVGAVLSVVLIGIPILMLAWAVFSLIAVWFAVRCVAGLYYLLQDQAYPRPDSWLI